MNILATSHVTLVMSWLVVTLGPAKGMEVGVVMRLNVKEVSCIILTYIKQALICLYVIYVYHVLNNC